MVGSCDDKEGEVVTVLVGSAQGDRLGGVLVGAHDRLGLRLRSLLRRLKARVEAGDVAIGAARVPGETYSPARRSGGCTAERYVALGEGRRRHARLFAHGGYLVGSPEPLRQLELDLYLTTRSGAHVYVAAPGLALIVL